MKNLVAQFGYLQRGIAAVDGEGALNASVMGFPGRRQILRAGDIIEQIQPRIEIPLVSVNAVKPEEYDRATPHCRAYRTSVYIACLTCYTVIQP